MRRFVVLVFMASLPLVAASCAERPPTVRPIPHPVVPHPVEAPHRVPAEPHIPAPPRAQALPDSAIQEARDRESKLASEFGALYKDALCAGMEQLADRRNGSQVRFSADYWNTFLIREVEAMAQGAALRYAHANVVSTVQSLVAAWELYQVSPDEARIYVRACVLPT